MPSVTTSGNLGEDVDDDDDDDSVEFVVDGANMIFIPLFFNVFKSIVYAGDTVEFVCWESGCIKHGNGNATVVVVWEGNIWGEEEEQDDKSIDFVLFNDDDDNSSEDFNLVRFIGRVPLDRSVNWAILKKEYFKKYTE